MFNKLREIRGSKNIHPNNIKKQWGEIKKNGYKFEEISKWITSVLMYFGSLPSNTKTTGKIQQPSGVISVEDSETASSYTELKDHVLRACRTTTGTDSKTVQSTIHALSMISAYIKGSPFQKELKEAGNSVQNWANVPKTR